MDPMLTRTFMGSVAVAALVAFLYLYGAAIYRTWNSTSIPTFSAEYV